MPGWLVETTEGLSPLARGNLELRLTPGESIGSIPARTGEPEQALIVVMLVRVYPRSHGGTHNNNF